MKIFEFDSPDAMRDGAVARQVDGDGKPVAENEEAKNARLARENAEMLAEEERKMEEDNHGLKFAIRPIKNFSIGRIEFPMEIINEVNEHIDNFIIPKSDSFADGLVGQLKNDEKSAQLDFPFVVDIFALRTLNRSFSYSNQAPGLGLKP